MVVVVKTLLNVVLRAIVSLDATRPALPSALMSQGLRFFSQQTECRYVCA